VQTIAVPKLQQQLRDEKQVADFLPGQSEEFPGSRRKTDF
jgi:hypothetical protein